MCSSSVLLHGATKLTTAIPNLSWSNTRTSSDTSFRLQLSHSASLQGGLLCCHQWCGEGDSSYLCAVLPPPPSQTAFMHWNTPPSHSPRARQLVSLHFVTQLMTVRYHPTQAQLLKEHSTLPAPKSHTALLALPGAGLTKTQPAGTAAQGLTFLLDLSSGNKH